MYILYSNGLITLYTSTPCTIFPVEVHLKDIITVKEH